MAGPGNGLFGPSIFVRSTDPVWEADIVAAGPGEALYYYYATPGAPWRGGEVIMEQVTT